MGKRTASQLHADEAGGFIDEVDGFIGKLPVGDVAVGKEDGCMDGRFGDTDAMEDLIPFAKAAQNGDGVFEAGSSTMTG